MSVQPLQQTSARSLAARSASVLHKPFDLDALISVAWRSVETAEASDRSPTADAVRTASHGPHAGRWRDGVAGERATRMGDGEDAQWDSGATERRSQCYDRAHDHSLTRQRTG